MKRTTCIGVVAVLCLTALGIGSKALAQAASPQKLVLAFYYDWYHTPAVSGQWAHWDECDFRERDPQMTDGRGWPGDLGAFHTPVLGAYDSRSMDVARRHVAWATSAGIDAFIVTWWRRETDSFEPILAAAAEGGMKVCLYYETIPRSDPEEAYRDLVWALDTYGDSPAFLKVGGRPVIFVYGRAMGQITPAQWTALLTRVRAHHEAFIFADAEKRDRYAGFDGGHTYNVVATVLKGTDMRAFYRTMAGECRAAGVLYAATVIPGFDNSRVHMNYLALDRSEGELYNELWEAAIASGPDWMIVTSFNEWHEGSEIEPSRELGDRYLTRTAGWVKNYKGNPGR